jgi:dUTP pyrophosphatase
MAAVKVKIVNQSAHALPEYATEGAAGMDLMASLARPVVIAPMQRLMVPTGLSIELPEGYEAQVRPRSGLAIKHGLTCLNSPGTIDADYRGEIQVILINLSDKAYTIQDGDRIAQMIVQKVETVQWEPVAEVGSTKRDTEGFGHTGK